MQKLIISFFDCLSTYVKPFHYITLHIYYIRFYCIWSLYLDNEIHLFTHSTTIIALTEKLLYN